MYSRKKRKSGSGIVETAAGLIVLIPVLLILVDVAALVMSQTANDALAKQCARAAADEPSISGSTNPLMVTAATDAYNHYPDSYMVKKSGAGPTVKDNGDGTVTVNTTITCTLPVPVPFSGIASTNFQAFSTEPIVGELPTGVLP